MLTPLSNVVTDRQPAMSHLGPRTLADAVPSLTIRPNSRSDNYGASLLRIWTPEIYKKSKKHVLTNSVDRSKWRRVFSVWRYVYCVRQLHGGHWRRTTAWNTPAAANPNSPSPLMIGKHQFLVFPWCSASLTLYVC